MTAGRQMENFIDVGHFSWIHAGTFGNRKTPEVPLYEVERRSHGFHVEYPYLAANPSAAALGASPTIQRWMTYDLHLPLACRLTVDFGEGRRGAPAGEARGEAAGARVGLWKSAGGTSGIVPKALRNPHRRRCWRRRPLN